jgi:predicted DNA-binding transcriptional regulator AlpA
MHDQYITFAEVCELTGISYPALARRAELWPPHPKPFKLFTKGAPKATVFHRQEMLEWLTKYNDLQEQLKALTTG